MLSSGNKLVFFGNERLATGVTTEAPVLRALVEAGYKVEAVYANHEDPISHQKRDLEISKVAQEFNIPVILPGNKIPLAEKLKKHPADVAVLVAYGKIVPQAVIDMFPKGIINIHPSLLPLYRGPTPIESVILAGDNKTGVSLMMLSQEMDAGPILAQRTVHLNGRESKQDLADKLLGLGKELLIETLPKYITGDIKPRKQSHPSRATYTQKINKQDGQIDWTKPAAQIEREIRAYADWPKSRTILGKTEVIITKAYVVPSNHSQLKPGDIEVVKEAKALMVECGQDCLYIESLKPAGKSEMTAEAFLAGYKI